jgi:hypothetical protein
MRRVYDELSSSTKSRIDEMVDEERIDSTLEMLELEDVKDLVGLAERIEEVFGARARKPKMNPLPDEYFDYNK